MVETLCALAAFLLVESVVGIGTSEGRLGADDHLEIVINFTQGQNDTST